MKMQRFYTVNQLGAKKKIHFSAEQSRQISRVLRMDKGQELLLFNGDGTEWIAEIIDVKYTSVSAIVKKINREKFRSPDFCLAIGLCHIERFEIAIEKCTELGANKFIPMITERVQGSSKLSLSEGRINRWRKIAIEASEQSGRLTIPVISEPKRVLDLIGSSSGWEQVFMGESQNINGLDEFGGDFNNPLIVYIGPPGGFTPHEIQLFLNNGVKELSLGPRTLRTETAAIAVSTLLNQAFK